MDSQNLLKTLCYTVENQTRFVCQDLNDENARWRPTNVNSSAIGWNVGHIIVLHDIMINQRICENPILFPDLVEHFGYGTDGNFPNSFTLKELFEKFKQLNSIIVKTILSKEESWFDEMFDTDGFPPNWQGKNRGKGFSLALNHGIAHTGQILEIKRMLGKGAWGF